MASTMTSLGFSGLGAGEIKRHSSGEPLLIVRDNSAVLTRIDKGHREYQNSSHSDREPNPPNRLLDEL